MNKDQIISEYKRDNKNKSTKYCSFYKNGNGANNDWFEFQLQNTIQNIEKITINNMVYYATEVDDYIGTIDPAGIYFAQFDFGDQFITIPITLPLNQVNQTAMLNPEVIKIIQKNKYMTTFKMRFIMMNDAQLNTNTHQQIEYGNQYTIPKVFTTEGVPRMQEVFFSVSFLLKIQYIQ